MQLDLLWKYQQADMEANRFENEMRKSPNRLELTKHRNYLLEQQEILKKIETEVTVMSDRMEAVQDEYKRLETLLDAEAKSLEESKPESVEEIKKHIQQIQKLVDSLGRYEQEISKMNRDVAQRDTKQKEIRARAAKIKAKFDAVKKEYDVELKADNEKLQKLKAAVSEASKKVPPELLSKYMTIRKNVIPPMAALNGDQCGGCHMSLPLGTKRRLSAGEELVECDNCGRIIYQAEK